VSGTRKLPLRTLALLLGLALLLAACGSSNDNSSDNNGGSNGSTSDQKKGGSLVFGAEQWPDCINPITQCANSSWLQWLVPIHVLPRLMELDTKNNFVASPLLESAPSLDNGDLDEGPPFSVTYHLNKDAVWSDGTPITSDDVEFSLHAYLDTKGSLSTAGYDQIDFSKVEKPDANTIKVVFKQPYSDWQDVGGGFSGVILQKSAFNGNTDVSAGMQNAMTFSGGPWVLKSFSKDQEILVRNEKYWDKDRLPLLDQVTFVPRTDTNAEVQALKSGEVAAIYPQPAADNVPQLVGAPGIKTEFGNTTQYESIWFNEKPGRPFEDENLRAAFSYAFDRQKFLDDIVKPFNPDVVLNNCAAWVRGVGNWCPDPGPYADVKPDADKVAEFMGKSGYKKDSSGIWAKDGKQLQLKWMANTGNKRREDTQAEFIPEMKKQGFLISTDNSDADTVFQQRLPSGDYDFSMFIQVTSPDPTVKSILSCDQIPGPENNGQGQNDWWYCNKDADKLIQESDKNLDTSSREDQIHDLGQILRDDYLNLPLYVFPALMAWREDKVAGPVAAYVNNPESNFFNMYDWSVK
jgi:peptide/nickel transport system substrate-binding protein